MTIDIAVSLLVTLITFIVNIMIAVTVLSIANKSSKSTVVDNTSVEKIKILMEKDSIDKINIFIDALIKNAADKYMILNVGYLEDPYLKSTNIEELTLYVIGMVKQNMTKSVIDTIGLIYDVDTEEKLDKFLELRIKIYVLSLSVKVNKTIME